MKEWVSKAHTSRSKKAEALRALKTGQIALDELLRAPYEPLDGADLWPVLLRAPGIGRKKAKRICLDSGVFPHKRLGELSDMERQSIISALPPKRKKRPSALE